MCLEDAIKEIINSLHGRYFDSHTVLSELLKNNEYHLAYMKDFCEGNYSTIPLFHSHIAKCIGSTGLVKQKLDNVITLSLHGQPVPNMLWEKV
ncbi:MAG: hypothetical protein LBM77_11765 [Spirochaetaceae bacterium]|jgi:hypothetical protein|nr:hypothetical protein [Spirochaetaceae bacterium]